MDRTSINFRQAMACLVLCLLGSALVTGGNRAAGRDTWLVILALTLVTILLGALHARILQLFPDKSFFEILIHTMGGFWGRAVSLVLTLYFLHLFGLVLADFALYVSLVSLQSTPALLIALPVAPISYALAKKGVQVIGRVSSLLFVFLLVYFAVIFVLSLGFLKVDNVLPLLRHPASELAESAAGMFAFPFGEVILFLPVLSSLKRGVSKWKTFAVGVLVGGLIFAYTALRNVTMLGEQLFTSNYYPSYLAASVITIENYLQHIEMAISFALLFCIFTKSTVLLYDVEQGMKAVFGQNVPKWLLPALAVGVTVLAMLTCASPQQIRWFEGNLYRYYAIPMQVGLPLLIWVAAERKARQTSKPPTPA